MDASDLVVGEGDVGWMGTVVGLQPAGSRWKNRQSGWSTLIESEPFGIVFVVVGYPYCC